MPRQFRAMAVAVPRMRVHEESEESHQEEAREQESTDSAG